VLSPPTWAAPVESVAVRGARSCVGLRSGCTVMLRSGRCLLLQRGHSGVQHGANDRLGHRCDGVEHGRCGADDLANGGGGAVDRAGRVHAVAHGCDGRRDRGLRSLDDLRRVR
jgi:hypothetical protein